MERYRCKFAFSMYETIEAKSKQEAKEKYIENMTKVMPRYGLNFDEDCKKSIIVKCVK